MNETKPARLEDLLNEIKTACEQQHYTCAPCDDDVDFYMTERDLPTLYSFGFAQGTLSANNLYAKDILDRQWIAVLQGNLPILFKIIPAINDDAPTVYVKMRRSNFEAHFGKPETCRIQPTTRRTMILAGDVDE